MNNATRTYAATFGAIMALAGLEHGLGEILQGNVAAEGIMILSWPESEFFRSLGGEPAMTLVPNLLVTGILAVLVSLALLLWAVLFVQRENSARVMILLSIAMLLVGGGIFPPIFGVLIGLVATRIHSPLSWWRANLPEKSRSILAKLWPWMYGIGVIAWFCVLPGIPLLERFAGVENAALTLLILAIALGALLLTIFASFARDIQGQMRAGSSPQGIGSQAAQASARKTSYV
jgi:hypothetical protein